MDKPAEPSDKPNDYEGPWHQYHVEKARFLRANTELAVSTKPKALETNDSNNRSKEK